jgi:hypothetical protein
MASLDTSKLPPTLTQTVSKRSYPPKFSLRRWRGILAIATLISGIGVGYYLLISAISYFVDTL